MDTPFSPSEAVKAGWAGFKQNAGTFIGTALVIGIVYAILSGISAAHAEESSALYVVAQIVLWVVSAILGMGYMYMALRVVDGEKAQFSDLWAKISHTGNYILTNIAQTIIIYIGFILLIVPGVIWAIKFYLAPYYVFDKDMKPMEALKASSAATKGHKMDIFLFFILLIIVNMIGALLLLIGLFVTIPLSIVATAYVYRALDGAVGNAPATATMDAEATTMPEATPEAAPATEAPAQEMPTTEQSEETESQQ